MDTCMRYASYRDHLIRCTNWYIGSLLLSKCKNTRSTRAVCMIALVWTNISFNVNTTHVQLACPQRRRFGGPDPQPVKYRTFRYKWPLRIIFSARLNLLFPYFCLKMHYFWGLRPSSAAGLATGLIVPELSLWQWCETSSILIWCSYAHSVQDAHKNSCCLCTTTTCDSS